MRSALLVIFLLVMVGCHKKFFHVGEYYAFSGSLTYDLELWPDSTFRYIKRYEWPIEVSIGKWHVEGERLILNSVPDPDPPPANVLTTGKYIMLHKKELLIRNRRLVEDSTKLKYKLYKISN